MLCSCVGRRERRSPANYHYDVRLPPLHPGRARGPQHRGLGEQQPGRRGNPRPGRWPGSHESPPGMIRGPQPARPPAGGRPAGRKRYWDNLGGREVEPATQWPQSA